MTATPTILISTLSYARRWAGPVFDKELRVASRRRRQYVLRFLHVLALTAFACVVWLSVVPLQANGAFVQSLMVAAGQKIVMKVALFQFFAAQILAIVLLSGAISDEVYHRTLGILMTTPISSFRIVMGKLLSRLLQLVLLLATSLSDWGDPAGQGHQCVSPLSVQKGLWMMRGVSGWTHTTNRTDGTDGGARQDNGHQTGWHGQT